MTDFGRTWLVLDRSLESHRGLCRDDANLHSLSVDLSVRFRLFTVRGAYRGGSEKLFHYCGHAADGREIRSPHLLRSGDLRCLRRLQHTVSACALGLVHPAVAITITVVNGVIVTVAATVTSFAVAGRSPIEVELF